MKWPGVFRAIFVDVRGGWRRGMIAGMSDEPYANIRELLPVRGCRVVEVSRHDQDEWLITGESFVMLHFDNGLTLRVAVTDDGGVSVWPPRS